MQMAGIYDPSLHDANKASLQLLLDPHAAMAPFFGSLGFTTMEEANVRSLLDYDDTGGELDMLRPEERVPDAILRFLKVASKRAYALRTFAHRERSSLLASLTKRNNAPIKAHADF